MSISSPSTITASPPPDRDYELSRQLGRIRDLTAQYMGGKSDAFEGFRGLADLLLRMTVLKGTAGVRLSYLDEQGERSALGGWNGPTDPLPLTDGRFLRLSTSLWLATTPDGPRLKVETSSYQYQDDELGKRWIFRYDYLRGRPPRGPHSHMHVNGRLQLSDERDVSNVHFPTERVSLEAIIRLLAYEFDVPCNEDEARWELALAESERVFHEIAHRPPPLSPPEPS